MKIIIIKKVLLVSNLKLITIIAIETLLIYILIFIILHYIALYKTGRISFHKFKIYNYEILIYYNKNLVTD
jgi:hypothetical protein